jgi:hypothetical protein
LLVQEKAFPAAITEGHDESSLTIDSADRNFAIPNPPHRENLYLQSIPIVSLVLELIAVSHRTTKEWYH